MPGTTPPTPSRLRPFALRVLLRASPACADDDRASTDPTTTTTTAAPSTTTTVAITAESIFPAAAQRLTEAGTFRYTGDVSADDVSHVRPMLWFAVSTTVAGEVSVGSAGMHEVATATDGRVSETGAIGQQVWGRLAADVYPGLARQVLRARERRLDMRVTINLTPWERGPPPGAGAMFGAPVRRTYRVVSRRTVLRFSCVSDQTEYDEQLLDLHRSGESIDAIYWALVLDDLRAAAETLTRDALAQRPRGLWRWRESHSEAGARWGVVHKLDVTLPAAELAGFCRDVVDRVDAARPGCRTLLFGHVGDGNVHVNVVGPPADDEDVDDVVLALVVERGGSISAEHGIGTLKRRWLARDRSPAEVAAMRAVKDALDPDGILNPGALFPAVARSSRNP